MTVKEAIDLADSWEENRFDAETKVKWLSLLDGKIYNEVILTHRDSEDVEANFPYTTTDMASTDLLVPDPYSDFYPMHLQAQIQLSNGDTARYNQSVALYNNAYQTWQDAYNRTHMPIQAFRHFKV